jgi:hypothetical protein
MNAAMFGMIIPDRNVPNFWTAIRVPPDFFAGTSVDVLTDCPFSRRWPTPSAPPQGRCELVTQSGQSSSRGNHNPDRRIRKSNRAIERQTAKTDHVATGTHITPVRHPPISGVVRDCLPGSSAVADRRRFNQQRARTTMTKVAVIGAGL